MFRKRKSAPSAERPEALQIIQDVIEGKLVPEEGAAQLKKHWFPSELMRARSKRPLIQTRSDSLRDLDGAATQLANQGQLAGARRLAELNWILAQRNDDQELMAQCAATLAQLLTGDAPAAERRLQLLEFCVPEVLSWDHVNDAMRAVMLANLADARYMTAGSDQRRERKAVQTIEQALELQSHLDDNWLGHLYRAAGTLYNELAQGDDLRRSVECNEKALGYYNPKRDAASYGSVLNNLGNSYRDLGRHAGDIHLLEQAIETYDKALPCRADPRLRQRTLGNKSQAQRALEELQRGGSATRPVADKSLLDQVKRLAGTGDDRFFASSKEGPQQESMRKSAAEHYLQAMKLLGREGPPDARAEILHRLAALFFSSTDDDKLWTAFCFANATRRLGTGWRASSLAAVDMHKGHMLTKIGYPNLQQYLKPAEALLQQALPVLKKQGRPGEYDQASKYLEMCQMILNGVDRSNLLD